MGFVKRPEEITRIQHALSHPRFVNGEMLSVDFLTDPGVVALHALHRDVAAAAVLRRSRRFIACPVRAFVALAATTAIAMPSDGADHP